MCVPVYVSVCVCVYVPVYVLVYHSLFVCVCLHVRVPVFMRRSEDNLQQTLVSSLLCGSRGLNLDLQTWG